MPECTTLPDILLNRLKTVLQNNINHLMENATKNIQTFAYKWSRKESAKQILLCTLLAS